MAAKLLPAGPLSTSGNQIVDQSGNPVRIASLGWDGGNNRNSVPQGLANVNYKTLMDQVKSIGFNCLRIMFTDAAVLNNDSPASGQIDYNLNPDLVGKTVLQVFDAIVAYAGTNGLKIIFDSHCNEGFGLDAQPNGLWYDVGGASDGTDGASHAGSITDAQFQTVWTTIASRYKGNNTVIGYDLRNKPNTTGVSTGSTQKQAVLSYLTSLAGKGCISGQFIERGSDPTLGMAAITAIHTSTNKWLGLIGGDYWYYNSNSPTADTTFNGYAKTYAAAGGLITLTVSMPNPTTGNGQTDNQTLNTTDLLVTGTPTNNALITTLNSIATGLLDLQNSGVVVMFRPFHENNGNWFWWGMNGRTLNAAQFISLWRYVHDYFTNTKKLTNLIWLWSVNAGFGTFPTAYPGDAYVDMTGLDGYTSNPGSELLSDHNALVALNKPTSLIEFGPNGPSGGDTNFDETILVTALKNNLTKFVLWQQWWDGNAGGTGWGMAETKNVSTALSDAYVKNRGDFTITAGAGGGGVTWGDGSNKDIRAMYQRVGNAILALDPAKLIICQGPQNPGKQFSDTTAKGGGTGQDGGCGDLTNVQTAPVVLNVSNKLVYSVTHFPQEFTLSASDVGGAAAIARMNAIWGWLVKSNIAPVWIAAMGSYFNGTSAQIAASTSWANTLVSYCNGTAATGPTFAGNSQGISTDWWVLAVDENNGNVPDFGILTAWSGGAARGNQSAYYSQLFYGSATPQLISAPLTGTVTTGTWQSGDLPFTGLFSKKAFHYNYLLPSGYSTANTYPILVYEHENTEGNNWYSGASTDPLYIVPQYEIDGAFNSVAFRTAYPCIVLVPYADQTDGTSGVGENFGGYNDTPGSEANERAVIALIKYFIANYSVYSGKVYVTGDSLGGHGSIAAALDYNATNGTVDKVVTAALSYAGQLYRSGEPSTATKDRMKTVPLFCVAGGSDTTSPQSLFQQPMWQYYTGNTTYPGPAGSNAGYSSYQAGSSQFYYLLDPNLGHDVWHTYRQLPGGKPMYDWLFAQTSGGIAPTPTPPPPSTGSRIWYQNPGIDGSFWVTPFYSTAQWTTSGTQITVLRNGKSSTTTNTVPTGHVHLKGDYCTPWYIGQATDPLWTVKMNDGSKTIQVRIPAGAITEEPFNVSSDSSIGGADATQPYLVWAANGCTISGNTINVTYGLQVDDGAGEIMTDAVTGQPGTNNALGTIQDYELTLANASSTYVIQHMLQFATDPAMVNSNAPAWPLKVIDTSFPNTGTLQQGITIGIPATTPRPAGKTRGWYLLFDNLQQYGWFWYNVSGTGCTSVGCYSNNPANSSLANDIAASISDVMQYVCILQNQTGPTTVKGRVDANSTLAFSPPPLLDLTPTKGVNVAPSTMGAWYPSGYNVTPPTPTATPTPTTTPTTTAVPLGVYVGNPGDAASGSYPGFSAQWDGFIAAVGRTPTVLNQYMDQTYTPSSGTFGWVQQGTYFASELTGNTRTSGATSMLSWPFGYKLSGQSAVNLFYPTNQIGNGSLDTIIQNTLGALKTGGISNLYIRPAWEFNLPNNYAVNATNLSAFITAWQHFYTVVKTYCSANNMTAKIIWCPNVGNNQNSTTLTVAQQYPGDSYVDIYGIDTYGSPVDGAHSPGATTTDATQYFVTTMINMAIASKKPISFCEVGGIDVPFATSMVSTLTNRASVPIEFFSMWDIDDTSGNLSWSNTSDNQPSLIGAWKTGFGPQGTVVNGTATSTPTPTPTPSPSTSVINVHAGLPPWPATASVVLGQRCTNNGVAYQCALPGVTAASGGPSGLGTNILDGTAHWFALSTVDASNLTAAITALPATFTQNQTIFVTKDSVLTTTNATPIVKLSGHTMGAFSLTLTATKGDSIRDSLATESAAFPLGYNSNGGATLLLPLGTTPAAINYIDIGDPTVILDGLQIRDPQSNSGSTIICMDNGCTSLTIRNCIIDGFAQVGGAWMLQIGAGQSGAMVLENCLIIDRQPASGTSQAIAVTAGITSFKCVNCTIVNPNNNTAGSAFYANGAFTGGIVKNCAIFGYTTVSTAGFTFDHCVTDAANWGSGTDGGNNKFSKAAANQFINPTSDWKLLPTSDCIDAASPDLADLPSGDDIARTIRTQGTAWDVGCFERQSWTPSVVRPIPVMIWSGF